MIVTILISHSNLHLVVALIPSSFQEILREQLANLIELVAGALNTVASVSHLRNGKMGKHA